MPIIHLELILMIPESGSVQLVSLLWDVTQSVCEEMQKKCFSCPY